MGPFGTNPQRLDSEGRHIADDVPEVEPQPFDTDEPDIDCPGCGDRVPHSVAYRDGPLPFHWNEQGGGHTMNPAAYEPQAWVDCDKKCPKCGNDMILRHHCEPSAVQQKLDAIRELCNTKWVCSHCILAILDREAP